MVKPGGSEGPKGSSERSLTPIIGFVLLLGMVVLGASAILLTAGSAVDDAQGQADRETAAMAFKQVDQEIATMTFGDKGVTSIHLEDSDSGEYEIVDDGQLNVTVTNGFGSACSTEYSLRSLQYEDESGDTIGYQAGGIWRTGDEGGSYVSAPDLRYDTETAGEQNVRRFDFQLTNPDGEVGSGDHFAKQQLNDSSYSECLDDRTFGYAQGVELTVSGTQFHEGWYQFLRAEFGAVDRADAGPDDDVIIEHDPDDREVTVTAPLEYDRPFVHYVNVEQTIYGGLYFEGGTEKLKNDLTIDGYDSREGVYEPGNASSDLLAANVDKLQLHKDVTLDGYVVSNKDIHTHPDSNITEYGFYTGKSTPSHDANRDAITFEISERFDSIEPIDDQIDLARSYLDGESDPPVDTIEAGLYHDANDVTLDDAKINTTDGDVHVYVSDDLELSNVTVTGPNRVYFYVEDEIEVDDDVQVPNDDAGKLWVYGSSGSAVTVEEDVAFQGVLYAPGNGPLEIGADVEIHGAVVGGVLNGDTGDDVEIHFDRSLRTDVPLPPDERSFEYEYRRPIDASIVLDASGSMNDNDPEKRRFEATKDFIDHLDEDKNDLAGLYEFDHEADTEHPMSSDLESVKESAGGSAGGYTNVSTGMEIALDHHEDVPDRGQKRVMVLLADGKNNFNDWAPDDHPLGGNETRADVKTIEQAERADDMGVTIYTIGLGYNDLDEELLQDIADTTGGENVNINGSDKLEDIFANIANDVTERAVIDFEGTPPAAWSGSNEHVVNVVEYDVELEDA